MTIEEQKQAGYITLKEASELFGYTPDYVGQLIRSGRIEGKQVYANVAWMTTAESIENYLSRERNSSKNEPEKIAFTEILSHALFSGKMAPILMWALRILSALLVLAFLLVFYFLSISLEHKLAQNAEQRLKDKQTEVQGKVAPLSASDHITYGK